MRSAIIRFTSLLAVLTLSQPAMASSLESALEAYVDGLRSAMARVTYELDFNGTTYVDYLLLYQRDDRWLVVAKTTFIK